MHGSLYNSSHYNTEWEIYNNSTMIKWRNSVQIHVNLQTIVWLFSELLLSWIIAAFSYIDAMWHMVYFLLREVLMNGANN